MLWQCGSDLTGSTSGCFDEPVSAWSISFCERRKRRLIDGAAAAGSGNSGTIRLSWMRMFAHVRSRHWDDPHAEMVDLYRRDHTVEDFRCPRRGLGGHAGARRANVSEFGRQA